jgi:hypothetical protein
MKKLGIIGFWLLLSILYTIFVWWFFDRNQAAVTNDKSVKCGPVADTVCVVDTLNNFSPIIEHSRILKK